MSAPYLLSEAAEQSLDDIFVYTVDVWGEAQARKYLTDLFSLFEAIAAGQEIGRLIQPEYGVKGRYAKSGKHYVYWYQEDGQVWIAEILHERMNLGDRLCAGGNLCKRRTLY